MDASSCLQLCLGTVIALVMLEANVQATYNSIASAPKSNSPPFVLPLYHRDDPSSPLRKVRTSMEEEVEGGKLVSRMLMRDAVRVEGISKRMEGVLKGVTPNKGRARVGARRGENVSSSVTYDGSGEFFTTMRVGYRNFQLTMDTGSDLVWLQCLPCQSCYDQTDPVFDPRASRTFALVNCTSNRCPQQDIMQCKGQACNYQQSYGDGSFTVGSIARENFYVDNDMVQAGVIMGCGHDNEGLFEGVAGLLGLGRGPLSLPSQISSRTFSYCLSLSSPGIFSLGHVNDANQNSDRVFTPLLTNPLDDLTYYYVPLIGMSIDGQMISNIRSSELMLQSSGRGGVILDSGTTITRFVPSVYYALRDAFREAATIRGYRPMGAYSIFDTCYLLPASFNMAPFPSIELHFQGGSFISLLPQNSMYPINGEDGGEVPLVCLAFAPASTIDFSILGNILQQGFLITFDMEAVRIGFLRNQC